MKSFFFVIVKISRFVFFFDRAAEVMQYPESNLSDLTLQEIAAFGFFDITLKLTFLNRLRLGYSNTIAVVVGL